MSSFIGDDYTFGLSALVTVSYQLFFFFIAAYFKFDKVTDLSGGSNFVIVAALVYLLGSLPSPTIRQSVVFGLVVAWGIRLSGFLFYRILVISEDHRFDGMRDDPCKFLVFWIFQMLWVWVVCLPLGILNSPAGDDKNIYVGDYVGFVMAFIGIIIEALADQSKFNFK